MSIQKHILILILRQSIKWIWNQSKEKGAEYSSSLNLSRIALTCAKNNHGSLAALRKTQKTKAITVIWKIRTTHTPGKLSTTNQKKSANPWDWERTRNRDSWLTHTKSVNKGAFEEMWKFIVLYYFHEPTPLLHNKKSGSERQIIVGEGRTGAWVVKGTVKNS